MDLAYTAERVIASIFQSFPIEGDHILKQSWLH